MAGQEQELSPEALALIAEEEALLSRVQQALAEARRQAAERTLDTQGLMAQLAVLRDDATTAHAADLPHVFTQMNEVRSMLERQEAIPLPDAHAPYFAHLRLSGPTGARDYLLGRTSFANLSAGVRVIDWRFAPVARVFYNYEEGDAFEESFGDRLSEGEVEARRLVIIEKGVLTRISTGPYLLQRDSQGRWHSRGRDAASVLAGGSGTAARPGFLGVGRGATHVEDAFGVTALLDAEQYAAVSTGPEQPLLVLGSAGSGKTTVALHRLAKVIFDDAKTYPQARTKVVVPEEGLARLTRRLLAPLGLGKVSVETLEAWSLATARSAFSVPGIKLSPDTPALVSRFKRHPALRRALADRVPVFQGKALPPTLDRLRLKLADAYLDRAFLEAVVADAKGELPRTVVAEVLEHTKQQTATPLSRQYKGFDEDRLVTVDGRAIEADTPDALAGTVDADDLPVLMFLKAQRGALGAERLAHVVLDEAEDFSLFELFVVSQLLADSRSCTLAGDEVQQTTAGFAGWDAALDELGIRDAATCRLQVSYRCPRPVVELAQHVLGKQSPATAAKAGREGAPVGFHHFPDEAQAWLFLGDALRDLVLREPHASVGVIASSREAAWSFHRVIREMPWARLVLEGDFSFEPGVDVTDVDNVKGLEFDYVVLPDVTARAYPADDEARRRLHVAVTRSSHQLWVASSTVRSPLIRTFPGADESNQG
ncbi:ATP-binding domain-containing protein [Corallococcus exiguus]|uniref:ATP-binding domain-containing protein n=1 Tax=Corallococcus exiguus TaxID=83462 RepID=UPI001470C76B|nr:ATP-binding domain-containing protein [Corallococcus exiguus]NNB84037.1 ATP-binding domain-containing protein [Corallococcus exiguus]NNB92396.1 ATP-binding domain-containing protein [Corallococcus exiguus]NNC02119.1 ATP-binding domain-containing protein [Corallococcus exiguus]